MELPKYCVDFSLEKILSSWQQNPVFLPLVYATYYVKVYKK